MTDLRATVRAAAARLANAGIDSAEVEAVALAAHVLDVDESEVHRLMVLGGRELPESYAVLVDDRVRRVPLQHLTGRAHFRRLTLAVGPGVFVPRPETEVLVDLALDEVDRRAREGADGIRVVDLCSGSGAISLAIKDERPDSVVRAIELSPQAWAWAVDNRDRLALDVQLECGDATLPCFADWSGTVDVVTVNPPYIPVGAVPIDPEVRDHDPEVALYGGSEDGLAIPLAVAATAARLLRPGGLVLIEHADTQGESLPRRLAQTGAWEDLTDHEDLTGRPRVTAGRRREQATSEGDPRPRG